MIRQWGVAGVFVLGLVWAGAAGAQGIAEPTWRLDGGLTFSRFEQQVKSEIGGAVGERLVEETGLGLAIHGTYRVWGPLALGLYAQYDVGSREAGRFEAFDAEGRAVTSDRTGGAYQELWLGPMLRLSWRTLFFEAAWGALGLRWDDARSDLPDADGEVDSALLTSPSIAWYVALGGGVPVTDTLQIVLRAEYRVRYYTRRSSGPFALDLAHGTQNLSPFVGVAWTP